MGFLAKYIAICNGEKAGHYCQNYNWYGKLFIVQLDQIKIYQLYKIILILL